MAIFTGSGVAIVTPFHENGEVNYEMLGELIEFQIAHKTDAIIICGTTGEASTMSHEEHLERIRYAVEKTAGRIPVIAGTGSNCTETAVYLSQKAETYGADGLLVVTPYYNKATQKGLIRHFTTVANAVSLPIVLYNVPGRTGCNILPETAAALCENVKNIVAIKEASGNIGQVARLAALTKGRMDIYSGNDDQVVPVLSLGGKGVISVLANIAPECVHDMVASYLDGDPQKSLEIQLSALPLIEQLFSEVNPIPVKKAVSLMGYEAWRVPHAADRDGTGACQEAGRSHAGLWHFPRLKGRGAAGAVELQIRRALKCQNILQKGQTIREDRMEW